MKKSIINFCKIRTVKRDILPIILLIYSSYTPNDIMEKSTISFVRFVQLKGIFFQ